MGTGPIFVLLTEKASGIKEFKFAPNVFPANSLETGEPARYMKSLLLDRGLFQADQRLFKKFKAAHVEESVTTTVEVIEVWNENSPYEMTLELSKVASNLTFNPTTSCSVERTSSRLRC